MIDGRSLGVANRTIAARIFRVPDIRGCSRRGKTLPPATSQPKSAVQLAAAMAPGPRRAADGCRRAPDLSPDAPLPVPKVSNYVQLTHDGQPKDLVGTDGSRLFLGFARTITYNATIGIMQMSISGGEPVRIPAASRAILPLNVSHDGAELLVKDNQGTATIRRQLWRLPILGGSPAGWALLSGRTRPGLPMASMLVYADGSELFLAKSDGTESRKLVSLRGPRPLSGVVTRGKQTEVYLDR